MNDFILDFYTKIDINDDAVDRILAKAKDFKPHRTTGKNILMTSICAAVLIFGIFSTVIISISKSLINNSASYSYNNISKFNTLGPTTDQVLIEHDGFCIWLSGAYFNGEKLYLALKGEKVKDNQYSDFKPNILKYSIENNDGFVLTVNDQKTKLKKDEILLNKDGKYFTGVIEVDTNVFESMVKVKMTIPYFEVYEGDHFISKASGPFNFDDVVNQTYTKNEERLVNTGDEFFISSIYSINSRSNENRIGIYMNYYIPDSLYDSLGEISAVLYNEDGSEISLIQEFETPKNTGYQKTMGFVDPIGKNIKVLFKNNGQTFQKYDVCLNDVNIDYAIDD